MVLRSYFKRKLVKWCLGKGYSEERCREVVETLDSMIEERIRRALREIIEGYKHAGGG